MDTDAIMPEDASGAEPRKKYIRTLEGDMKTLQEGGVPDLAPFVESKDTVPEPPKPPEPEPAQAEMEPAEPELVASPLFNASSTVAPTPSLPPESVSLPPPQPMPVLVSKSAPVPTTPAVEQVKSNPIETYANDFSERMKDTHASLATVLAAEQDAAPQSQTTSKKSSERIYIIAGVVLLIIGAVGAYFAYAHYMTAVAPVISEPGVSAPIFVDDREQLSGAGPVLLQAIEKSVDRSMTENTVRLLYLLPSSTTTNQSVFSALNLSAPDILLRNVNTKGSMAGVVSINGSQSPFFILSIASYSDTFAGMLSWESFMPRDLSALFPAYATPALSVSTTTTTTIATTTKSTTTTTNVSSAPRAFKDEVIDNHDVRVYRDAFGRTILLYGYWNRTTLVIARDSAAFTEILGRLATSRAP